MPTMAIWLFLRHKKYINCPDGGYMCTKIFYSWNLVTLAFKEHICNFIHFDDPYCTPHKIIPKNKNLFKTTIATKNAMPAKAAGRGIITCSCEAGQGRRQGHHLWITCLQKACSLKLGQPWLRQAFNSRIFMNGSKSVVCSKIFCYCNLKHCLKFMKLCFMLSKMPWTTIYWLKCGFLNIFEKIYSKSETTKIFLQHFINY